MLAEITNTLLKSLVPAEKPYDVRDTRLKGFIVRVNTSGKLVYMCEYGRAKRIQVGRVGVISLTDARDEAKKVLSSAVNGVDPKEIRKLPSHKNDIIKSMTLREYIENKYAPWIETHNTSGRETVVSIKNRFFEKFGDIPLNEISLLMIDEWRTERLESVSEETINRNIASLRPALGQAVQWNLLDKNPLAEMNPLKTSNDPIIRYLTKEEEKRLRQRLKERDNELKDARKRTNKYRKTTTLPQLPDLSNAAYADHLHPMILLTMNTGVRRGELFRLEWKDINFEQHTLVAKSRKSRRHKIIIRHIPLNSEALTVLKTWHEQCPHKEGPVFINEETGKAFTTVKTAWETLRDEAKLKNFRWHDFRHHFASKLVMASVDLNTVRELLGHSSIKTTLRYAHLAPKHKADAVERLVS